MKGRLVQEKGEPLHLNGNSAQILGRPVGRLEGPGEKQQPEAGRTERSSHSTP